MRLSIERPAPAGSVYAPTAFASVVGQTITVDVLGTAMPGKVVAAEVIHAGRSVKLTIDVEGDVPTAPVPRGALSISYDALAWRDKGIDRDALRTMLDGLRGDFA